MTLVISETLKNNRKEGMKVAIVPLITDIPIVLITILIISKLSSFNLILGSISILGSIFVGYLAYENISLKEIKLKPFEKSTSFRKGIIVNFLNPNPYIFWFTVGAPLVVKALDVNVYAAASFIAGFYIFLVGSQISVAVIVEKYSHFLKSRLYIYLIRITGAMLLVFAFLFLKDGLRLLSPAH